MFVLVLVLVGIFAVISCEINGDQSCCNRFEYEYNVLQKLSLFEEKIKELDDAKAVIQELKSTMTTLQRRTDGSSYIRWGRFTCPSGSILVYNGYAAGEYYENLGGGANILCLHSDPKWNQYVDGFQTADHISGVEYVTYDYSYQRHVHLHDVPCVVCRIPSSNVLMVPGTNTCDKDFKLEYHGYLMTSHYSHANNNEYICVDKEPDTLERGAAGTPGKYLYFVQARCGALKCPPYVPGRELTCAVCSFHPSYET